MCRSMVDIQPPTAEIRRGKKEDRNYRMKILWSALLHRATIIIRGEKRRTWKKIEAEERRREGGKEGEKRDEGRKCKKTKGCEEREGERRKGESPFLFSPLTFITLRIRCPTRWLPSEYRWRPLLKMTRGESSIIHSLHVPRRKVWLTPTARVPCTSAANIERKTWTQSEFCTWQNSVMGQEPPKVYIECTSPGDGQTSCKVWLISVERPRCSNEAKTRNP